jgi:nucleoid-associated protein YgaU
MRSRIFAPVGFVVLGAVIAVLIGYPFVHRLATDRDHLTHRLAGLETGLSSEQARAAALQNKLDTRNQEIAAANLRQQRDDLWRASEAQAAKQTAARISKLNEALAAAQGSGAQTQQKNTQLQQRLDELHAQSADQQKQLAERGSALTLAHQQQQKMQAQLAERNAALLQAQEQRQKLEAQLAAGKKAGQQQTTHIAALTDALQQARDRQQALQTEVDTANTARQAAEAQIADLQQKLASAQQQPASTAPAVLTPATGGNESLQRRLAELQAQLNRYTAQRPAAELAAAHESDDLAGARQRAAKLTAAYKAQLENAAKQKHVNTDTLDRLAAARSALEKAQAEIARIEGARGIYTVQGGDSLSLIAAFFYHNGNRWPQIFESNAFLVSNPDLIFPGMVLVIPE